ncbi:hypothetical protein BKA70DRAFT_1507791 [Coprinopsis sp. MPI-PUGE-AT-0042]|nr:hypothetical protein BKA70DRAFT_1507791 [Coprinopsis sp. MPI-PUGE-AT-0042]
MSLPPGTRLHAHDNDPEIVYSGAWSELPSIVPGEFGTVWVFKGLLILSPNILFRYSRHLFGLAGTAIKYFVSLPQLPNRQTGLISLYTTFDGEGYLWELVAGSVPFFGIVPFERSGLDPDQEHVISVTNMAFEKDGMGALPLRFDGFEFYTPDLSSSVSLQSNVPSSSSLSAPLTSSSLASRPTDIPFPSPTIPRVPTGPPSDSPTYTPSLSVPVSTQGDSVVTKILPQNRVITVTDSTGGITAETSAIPLDATSTGRPPTAMVIAIIMGVLMLSSILAVVIALLLRRRKRMRQKRSGIAEKTIEAPEMIVPSSPWAATISCDLTNPQSSPSSSISPMPWPIYREKGVAALNPDLAQAQAPEQQNAPPPAYRAHVDGGGRW